MLSKFDVAKDADTRICVGHKANDMGEPEQGRMENPPNHPKDISVKQVTEVAMLHDALTQNIRVIKGVPRFVAETSHKLGQRGRIAGLIRQRRSSGSLS